MRIGFCISELKEREKQLADNFISGLRSQSHNVDIVDKDTDISRYDLISIIGVKSMERMKEAEEKAIPYLYFDKGYSRKSGYWRVAINAHQPTDYLHTLDYPDDRRYSQGWEPRGWKNIHDGCILIAGSSLKFHNLKSLPHPTEYAKHLVSEIRKYTRRKIIYRPKPSWKEAEPIKDTQFSREKGINEVLPYVSTLVTFGSNACFEALLNGVPSIVLGDGVTRSISSNALHMITEPHKASKEKRIKILNNLAYCQFSPDEFKNGIAWDIIRDQIRSTCNEI